MNKKINLNKISDLKEFVRIAGAIPDDVYLTSNEYKVNGKSILGIMSLDLSQDIYLNTSEEYINCFSSFFVE